jgi:hypothetical protein
MVMHIVVFLTFCKLSMHFHCESWIFSMLFKIQILKYNELVTNYVHYDVHHGL